MVVRAADVYVSSDVVVLDAAGGEREKKIITMINKTAATTFARRTRNSPDGLVKVREGFVESVLRFQGVSDVVVQFGVEFVHLQTRREYRVLRRPVPVSRVRFHHVGGY